MSQPTGDDDPAQEEPAAPGHPDAGTGPDQPADDSSAWAAVRFAAIGDFGFHSEDHEAEVAKLVRALGPDFVITAGDNNYPRGEAATLDLNVGLHYAEFIAPYTGSFGPGASENRFFPSPGNHDWGMGNLDAYLSYFSLPGNERYYAVRRGPVHLFAIDSDPAEPDGIAVDSVQASWLRAGLLASSAPFKVVFFHHPPYSSGQHGNQPIMAWPFAEWGASLVIAGHEHDYERLVLSQAVPLVVNGIGGVPLRPMRSEAHARSMLAYDGAHGAMLLEADDERLRVRTLSTRGELLDSFMLKADVTDATLADMRIAIPYGASYQARTEEPDGTSWPGEEPAQGAWHTVRSPVGFGAGDEASVIAPETSTLYLRHAFELADLPVHALLSLVCDDGAAVYLNGHEVHRVNLPEGELTASTLAAYPVKGPWEARAATTLIDERHFVPGVNVLAVEVHQASLDSSDLRFDLELRVK